MGLIKFPYNFERLAINQNKKNSCSTYYSFNVFFSIITYNFLPTVQLLASYNRCLPSLLAFTLFLRLKFAVLQKPCQGNFGKFQEFGKIRFGIPLKDCYFLKILKCQHKLVWDYKRGKLVCYFLNNATKTCLYGLKISENIEIEYIFQYKAFFHLSGNLHTSCFSAFKYNWNKYYTSSDRTKCTHNFALNSKLFILYECYLQYL